MCATLNVGLFFYRKIESNVNRYYQPLITTMIEQLLITTIDLLWKQLLLRSVVERLVPQIRSPLAKAVIGLSIRTIQHQFKHIIDNGLFDEYCDISYIEYILLPKNMLCEYRIYIEHGMKWFLDFINRILAEDDVKQSIKGIHELLGDVKQLINGMQVQINDIRGDIHDIRFQLQPSLQFSALLTTNDLRHE